MPNGQAEASPLNEKTVYRQNAGQIVALEVIDQEMVVLPKIPATVFVLNASATLVWAELEAGASVGQFTDMLHADDPMRSAIKTCFEVLLDAGMICPADCLVTDDSTRARPDLVTEPKVMRWSRSSEAEQITYFDTVLELTRTVENRIGTQTRYYDIADVSIKVIFASDVLEALFAPALAHCETARTKCDLTLHVWDGVSSATDLSAPLSAHSFSQDGSILGMPSMASRIAFDWDTYSISLANEEAQTGIYWIADPATLDETASKAPLHILLSWVLQWHDRYVLRGSAFALDEHAALVLDLPDNDQRDVFDACRKSGMALMADRYCVVTDQPGLHVTTLCSAGEFPIRQGPVATTLRAVITRDDASALPRHGIAQDHRANVALKLSEDMLSIPRSGPKAQRFAALLAQNVQCGLIADNSDALEIAAQIRNVATETGSDQEQAPKTPLVSIIIPVLNEVRYLTQALDSIAAQAVDDLEVIIVDDGSEIPVANLAGTWPFTPHIIRQDNAGPSAARNTGIRHAAGDLIAFLDGDDLWPEGRLSDMISAFDAVPESDVVMGFGQTFELTQPDGVIQTLEDPEKAFPYYLGSALFRRIAFARVGLLDEDMRFAEDTDWFNRANEALLTIHHLRRVTLLVRRHATNVTGQRTMVELGELRMIKKKHARLFWRGRRYPDWPRDPWCLRQTKL